MKKAMPDIQYIAILCDGMADDPLESLDGKTPLEAARTPHMDAIAESGVVGSVDLIPDSLPPGSDVGNLAVLGYDPEQYLTGRAPLEAAAMNISIPSDQTAFRCNLVTLENRLMKDYSAGHISSEEAAELIEAIQDALGSGAALYPGVQYRHLLLASDNLDPAQTTPPHDIMGECFREHYPTGAGSGTLRVWIERSWEVLRGHPINKARMERGQEPANSVWLWGQGKAPTMPTYPEKYGLNGAAVSAVDLVRGIARYAGLDMLKVPGITGFLDTNYAGKAEYALASLDSDNGVDFVYIHIEAPDEAAHMGSAEAKIEAIEAIDREIASRVMEYARSRKNVRVAALPDHVTAVSTRKHARGAVPFAACGPGIEADAAQVYTEASGARGRRFDIGHQWMDWFLGALSAGKDR